MESLQPPALGDHCHGGLACRGIAVRWGSILVVPEGQRPHPRRSYGRRVNLHHAADRHHPRQHEAFDCHALKRNRQEECVQMPVKIARSTPRPSFGLPELLVASHISRLASRDAAKSLLSTLVSESSGECRLK
jgi:hypothetical protein